MTLGPRSRKVVLTVHVLTSVGWMGACAAYLSLTVAAMTSDSHDTVRAAFVSMEIVYFALVPLAAGALLTGLIQAFGTNWGLFRHYWVLTKLVLTVVAITVMVLNLANVSSHADQVSHGSAAESGAAAHDFRHAAGGLAILSLTAILGLYKPRALTRYGRRKRNELRARRPAAAEEHPAFGS
ncbi:MAG TPA: hypothetical protein VHG69_11475 [Thermoleophilaceae bacterium]|nr:hypothetical protein [Thermoleophilaceae bacterium]